MSLRDRVVLAGRAQPLQGILPDRLQQAETAPGVLLHERLIHERGEQIECLASAKGFRCLQRKSPDKDRQAAQECLLRLGEEIVTPVDRAAEGLMPGPARAAAAHQQMEAIVQSCSELLDGECPQPRGRQLDRQRQGVQPPADLRHRGGVLIRERKAAGDSRASLGKEADGLVLKKAFGQRRLRLDLVVSRRGRAARGNGLGGRQRERRDRPDDLAGDPQRLAAGGEHTQAGTAAEQRRGKGSARCYQVLAVVENQQEFPVAEELLQSLHGGTPRRLGDAQSPRHSGSHGVQIGQRRQIDKRDAVLVVAGHGGGDLQR